MIRVAINGYGRIGRLAHRIILDNYQNDIEVVAINTGSSTDLKGWMYLLKYDSEYGPLGHEISINPVILNPDLIGGTEVKNLTEPQLADSSVASLPQNDNRVMGSLIIDGKETKVFSQKDPSLLPWKDLNIDVVIEATGKLRKEEELKKHLTAGAKAVVLSAPLKEGSVPTYVISVNDKDYKGENAISNASCTTNCIAPIAKIINDHFGIEKAMMTTIHGYTSDQKLQDGGHKDYRRARAAGVNIIPTSTGAAKAIGKVIPSLDGIFSGLALRVPIAIGSLSDFTFILKRAAAVEEVNNILKQEAQNPNYQGILQVTEDPIVSSDVIGNPYSSIADLSLTQVVGGNMLKIIAWYDNEYGYANRLVEEVFMVGKHPNRSELITPNLSE